MGPWSTVSRETVGARPPLLAALSCHGFCGSWRGAGAEAVGTCVLGSRALSQCSAETPESLLLAVCTQHPLPKELPQGGGGVLPLVTRK